MHKELESMLETIGYQLDQGIYPRIFNGGIVMPNELTVTSETLGQVQSYDKRKKQRRSETRPRSRHTRWQRPAYRQRSTSRTTPHICADIQEKYEAELNQVHEAYPNTRVWHQAEGMWLLTESSLLPELGRKTIFLTGIPFVRTSFARSWGFWLGYIWIGPRHTNFPDGSICAYEPTDGTWSIGDPIVKLLDLYTLWALRQLHLQTFGRFPGYQAVHHPYERILEIEEGEFCGCENSNKLYSECCQEKDLARNRIADAVNFVVTFSGRLREPPEIIAQFVREQQNPPSIKELLF